MEAVAGLKVGMGRCWGTVGKGNMLMLTGEMGMGCEKLDADCGVADDGRDSEGSVMYWKAVHTQKPKSMRTVG